MERMELKKNEMLELTITGTTHDGSGVGRTRESMVVFVPAAAEGELVRAQVLRVGKGQAFAKLREVLRPSPARVEPDCPVFSQCGGCAFRHLAYEEELRLKRARVRDALQRIAGLPLEPEEILGSERMDFYRNKAEYPVGFDREGRLAAGFYAPHSHRIVPVQTAEGGPGCRLQPPAFGELVQTVLRWMKRNAVPPYDEETGRGLVRHIYIRQAGGELLLCLIVNAEGGNIPAAQEFVRAARGATLPDGARLGGIVLNYNAARTNVILGPRCETLWGKGRLAETLGGVKFEISPLSFFQVNTRQAERLYTLAAEFAALGGNGRLLDLYCGTGTIGLFLARGVPEGLRAGELVGVETVPQAVEDARRNAAANGIPNARFLCADAGQAAARLLSEGFSPDAVVVDPPRRGCDDAAVDAVAGLAPARIVYISCDPATLARDLKKFGQKGYFCARVKPVDMFPRTPHVETVVLMSRVKD